MPVEFIDVAIPLLQPCPEGDTRFMPDGMGSDRIGGQPCPPHVFADINAEVAGGISDERLNRRRFDEEAVVSNGRDALVECLRIRTRVRCPVKIGCAIRFPKPPAERVIRPKERKVAIKGWVVCHPGIVSRVCTSDCRVLCRCAKIAKEGVTQELVVTAEEANNPPFRLLDAIGFGFLRIAFPHDEDFQLLLRERLVVDRCKQLLELSLILWCAWDDE